MGVIDPIYGIGQIVPRALEKVTSLGGLAENPISRAYGRSAENVDKGYKQVSGQYEAQRATPDDFDWGRLTGKCCKSCKLDGCWRGRCGYWFRWKNGCWRRNGASSAAMPVENTDNYWEEKLNK